jgi:hypothetical protein
MPGIVAVGRATMPGMKAVHVVPAGAAVALVAAFALNPSAERR